MYDNALDAQRQEKAREYARLTRRLFFFDLALGAAFLLVFLFSGLSSGLRNLLDFPQSARVSLYFIILMVSYGIISAPLGVYRGFVLPHRYGLSHQRLRAWLADEAKGLTLSLSLGTALVVIIYLFLQRFPETWWLLAFALVVLVMIVLTWLSPVLILPIFFKMSPLSDAELRQRLLNLAKRSHIKVREVYQINFSSKTSTGNAMVMGWGGTRRIVLSDTLLHYYTPEEIEVIMAHELGHHRHGDIARLIAVQSVLMLLGFYLMNLALNWAVPGLDLKGISDVAAFPLLVLVMASFALLLMPLANAYSRHLEESADRYALAATANPEAFATMLTKLTDQNLSESEPGRWSELLFYTHPPYSKRLALASHFQEERRQ